MKPRNRWIYLTLVAVTCLTLLPFWVGNFYGTGDMRDVYIPLEHYFQSQELKGILPSWDPNASWGFPVVAAAQIGFFYPPLLLLRFLPIAVYLPLIFALHIGLALFGMFFFMRRLGTSLWASFLGAISFGLSAFIFEHATHLNIVMACGLAALGYALCFMGRQ